MIEFSPALEFTFSSQLILISFEISFVNYHDSLVSASLLQLIDFGIFL